jgi:pyridoxamine 5'-phosphate oxidase
VIREVADQLRREYELAGLTEDGMAVEPFTEFERWFAGVLVAQIHQPKAFVFASVGTDGQPSARAVMMTDFSPAGLIFYTGLESRKSQQLGVNAVGAATFVWTPLQRQVRFEGRVTRLPDSEADVYFASRSRTVQIVAHASRQGEVVTSRRILENRVSQLPAKLGPKIVRPDHWGGWQLAPSMVEFWQGRPDRIHDRIRYTREGGGWVKDRLSP